MAQMARSLADEMASERIRVNCVAPGFIRSYTSGRIWKDSARLAAMEQTIPLGRIGEPQEVAGAVVFLASSAGAYVTGTTIYVDGGRAFLNPPQRTNPLQGAERTSR
jgi:NAD(P)-dependent dehydrogenase (short-subunit alcohol dehydrogenase family)